MSTSVRRVLRDYLREVRVLPRPSARQVDNFVDYVASAHSWYKHLPFFPPGAVFIFFVDPFAGYDQIIDGDGVVTHRRRQPDAPKRERFHYTWQPTDQYVSAFGHLHYHTSEGTSFFVGGSDGTLVLKSVLSIETREGSWIPVPEEVRHAGSTQLTSTVHPFGNATLPLYDHALGPRGSFSNVLYGIRRIGRGGLAWLSFHLKPIRMHAEEFGSEVSQFARSVDPTCDPATLQRLEQDARQWFVQVRHGVADGHPSWLRKE